MAIKDFRGEFAFLSNFAPCEVEFEGIKFQSTEAAYQAAKTKDLEARKEFRYLGPGEAKRLGNKIEMRKDWESIKLGVMEEVLRKKFSTDPYKQRLIDTGDQDLIEENWWNDTWWGVCKGKGLNNLGKLLMKIREELALNKNEIKNLIT